MSNKENQFIDFFSPAEIMELKKEITGKYEWFNMALQEMSKVIGQPRIVACYRDNQERLIAEGVWH